MDDFANNIMVIPTHSDILGAPAKSKAQIVAECWTTVATLFFMFALSSCSYLIARKAIPLKYKEA